MPGRWLGVRSYMDRHPFKTRNPYIAENELLRAPQREAYAALAGLEANGESSTREVGIVLPVGCGKSGCVTLTPFAFRSTRALVVAPGVKIAQQLHDNFDPAHTSHFYTKCRVLDGQPYPEPVEIRGTTTNRADLEEAHVVITNIQQLQGEQNRWLEALPSDFFDLIVFDEGHHNVAASWNALKEKFPAARIVNYSATPQRADGQLMAGEIIYSFPVARAIEAGYVKRLKAVVLNPRSLRYVRREDGREIEVDLDEVRRLGEEEADFRRSIVTSEETLATIVDASIRALQKRRAESGDHRLKIIASALNYEHCRQIVGAYRARGQRAGFVHSRADAPANQRVLSKLENHELDVIVQVRKLGEGFDHPYLAVAAIFSVFSSLSPFVQFVGRIMRVIKQDAPGHPLNQGTVIFHAGANIARRWEDFQEYSEADKAYFDTLLPLEGLEFGDADELEITPQGERPELSYEVRGQAGVELEEIPLLRDDPEAQAALRTLRDKGYTREEVAEAYEALEPVPVTKARRRQAMRAALDQRILLEAGRILRAQQLNPGGRDLDRQRLGRSNFVVVKAALDRRVNALVGRRSGERHEFTQPELEQVEAEFDNISASVVAEFFSVEA